MYVNRVIDSHIKHICNQKIWISGKPPLAITEQRIQFQTAFNYLSKMLKRKKNATDKPSAY